MPLLQAFASALFVQASNKLLAAGARHCETGYSNLDENP
jgi:hypothetical protein